RSVHRTAHALLAPRRVGASRGPHGRISPLTRVREVERPPPSLLRAVPRRRALRAADPRLTDAERCAGSSAYARFLAGTARRRTTRERWRRRRPTRSDPLDRPSPGRRTACAAGRGSPRVVRGRDGVAQLRAADARRLARTGRTRRLLDLHLHQLAAHA